MNLSFVNRQSFQLKGNTERYPGKENSNQPGTQKTGDKLFGLDHLRSLAIALVFLFHYGRLFPHPEWTNTISKFGWTGVDLFFVLSGFLIASQLFTEITKTKSVSFKSFFIKRFFRIMPAYLVVVAVYFLFPSVHEREALPPLWKFLTFTQNLGLNVRSQGTFSHAWSLCIEEQFYLALPLILSALVYFKILKKSFWLLAALFLFGSLVRYSSYQNIVLPAGEEDQALLWYKFIYYPTYCRLDGLLIGVSLAALLHYHKTFSQRVLKHGNAILLLGTVVLSCAYLVCLDEESFDATVFGFPVVSMGYGLLVLGAASPASFLYKFQSPITAKVAAWSYVVYLVHKFVVHVAQDQFSKLGLAKESNAVFVLCVLAVVIIAWLMNEAIEKPFLKIRKRLITGRWPKQEVP